MTEQCGGVPRRDIPWGPSIDYDRCVSCMACEEYCHKGVFEQRDDGDGVVVASPRSCVLFCDGCTKICTAGAISFPDPLEIAALIRRRRAERLAS